MNSLKIFTITLAIPAIFACSSSNSQETAKQSNSAEYGNGVEAIEKMAKKSMQNIEITKYHEYIDPNNGLVQFRFPLPRSWKVNHINNPVYIEGPNNLKVYKSETNNYSWSNDPMMRQTLQMSGQILEMPKTNQQILNQFVRPNAEAKGYQFLGSNGLDEVSGFWQRFINALPNTGTHRQVEALGTDWEVPARGTKSFIVLVRYQIVNQQTILWFIQTTELETESANFEKAKNAYLYASAKTQLNPQWMQHMNGQLIGNIQKSNEFWAQASAQSAAAHQQRMNAIAARGNTSKSIGDTYSDILDISHQGFLNRSHINDLGHSRNIRAINETTLIGNHETGEHYSIPSGSKYYWVSNDGRYIGTDNALFNPNTEKLTNDNDWTKFAVEH